MCLPIYLSVFLSVCQPIHLYACLSVQLIAHPFSCCVADVRDNSPFNSNDTKKYVPESELGMCVRCVGQNMLPDWIEKKLMTIVNNINNNNNHNDILVG